MHYKFLKWKQELGDNFCETLMDFRQLHSEVYKLTNVSKLRSFQYRVLQRGLITNIQLYKWQVVSSNMCTFCSKEKETVSHLLYECDSVKEFWDKVCELVHTRYPTIETIWNVQSVLNNRVVKTVHHVVNFICLFAKQHIYAQRCLKKQLSIAHFKRSLLQVENMEKYIAMKNGKIELHDKKWSCKGIAGQVESRGLALNDYVIEYINTM